MSEPKMSELMRAAAKGIMAKYMPPDGWQGQWMSGPYSNSDRSRDEATAGMFTALANVYEAHEKQSEPTL